MADTNKRVTFTGVDNGVESMMSRLRSSAETTSRDLIRQAREYSSSGKEVTKYIEEEIRAIEKRGQTYARAESMKLQQQKNVAMEGAGTGAERQQVSQQFAAKSSALSMEVKQDKMQLDLMRELIDTVRSTAKQEMAEDRKAVEEAIDANENITQRGIDSSADELDELKQTLQHEAVGEEHQASKDEDQAYRRATGKKVEQVANKAASLGGLDNEIYMIAGAAAMIPLVGQGISMIAQKFMQKGEELEKSAGANYAATGLYRGPQYDEERGEYTDGMGYDQAYKYGKTQSELLAQHSSPLSRQVGAAGSGGRESMYSLMAEAGMGVDMGTQMGSARLGRGDTAFDTNEGRMKSMVKAMQAGGLAGASGQDLSFMPELMETQNSIGREQLTRLGTIDTGINQAMMTELAGMGDVFKNPDVLASVVQNLDAGLRTPANSYSQAAQFAVLRQQNPGASRWELMKMQEQGIQDPDQVKGVLGRLSKSSGSNKELFYEQIKSMFPGLSLAQSEELGAGYLAKGDDFMSKDIAAITGGQKGVDAAGRAYTATGTLERKTANIDEMFAKSGKQMNEYLENKMEDFGEVTEAFSGGLLEGTKALGSFITGLDDFSRMVNPDNNGIES